MNKTNCLLFFLLVLLFIVFITLCKYYERFSLSSQELSEVPPVVSARPGTQAHTRRVQQEKEKRRLQLMTPGRERDQAEQRLKYFGSTDLMTPQNYDNAIFMEMTNNGISNTFGPIPGTSEYIQAKEIEREKEQTASRLGHKNALNPDNVMRLKNEGLTSNEIKNQFGVLPSNAVNQPAQIGMTGGRGGRPMSSSTARRRTRRSPKNQPAQIGMTGGRGGRRRFSSTEGRARRSFGSLKKRTQKRTRKLSPDVRKLSPDVRNELTGVFSKYSIKR